MKFCSAVLILSIVISSCGTFSNSFSLVYLITKDRAGLGKKLLIFLNALDLCTCIFSTTVVALAIELGSEKNSSVIYLILHGFKSFFVEGTAYATCALCVTRALSLSRPFYVINNRAIAIASTIVFIYFAAVGIFFTYSFTDSLSFYRMYNYQMLGNLLMMLQTVLVANVVSVIKLLKGRRCPGVSALSDTRERATTTVLILAALFFLFNTLYASGLVIVNMIVSIPGSVLKFLEVTFWLAVPLNSALNSVVYFVRKQEMRLYLSELFLKMRSCRRAGAIKPPHKAPRPN